MSAGEARDAITRVSGSSSDARAMFPGDELLASLLLATSILARDTKVKITRPRTGVGQHLRECSHAGSNREMMLVQGGSLAARD